MYIVHCTSYYSFMVPNLFIRQARHVFKKKYSDSWGNYGPRTKLLFSDRVYKTSRCLLTFSTTSTAAGTELNILYWCRKIRNPTLSLIIKPQKILLLIGLFSYFSLRKQKNPKVFILDPDIALQIDLKIENENSKF